MLDHEKSDLLKAKLLADRSKDVKTSEPKKPTDLAKTLDSSVSLLTFALGFVSTFFTQQILLAKFTLIVPFSFWESLAIYFCFTSMLKMFTKALHLIFSSLRKT